MNPLTVDLIGLACALVLAGMVCVLCRELRRARAGLDRSQRMFDYVVKYPALPQVQTVSIAHPHRFADPEKELVRVIDRDGKPIALGFTDALFTACQIRGQHLDALLKSGEATIQK